MHTPVVRQTDTTVLSPEMSQKVEGGHIHVNIVTIL